MLIEATLLFLIMSKRPVSAQQCMGAFYENIKRNLEAEGRFTEEECKFLMVLYTSNLLQDFAVDVKRVLGGAATDDERVRCCCCCC